MQDIVRFIYRHALSMIEPWDDAVLETLIAPRLTDDGFEIVAPADPGHYVGMRDFMGTIFVLVRGPMGHYTSMAHDQKRARTLYDETVKALLAA
jgi:hypothetical protein